MQIKVYGGKVIEINRGSCYTICGITWSTFSHALLIQQLSITTLCCMKATKVLMCDGGFFFFFFYFISKLLCYYVRMYSLPSLVVNYNIETCLSHCAWYYMFCCLLPPFSSPITKLAWLYMKTGLAFLWFKVYLYPKNIFLICERGTV